MIYVTGDTHADQVRYLFEIEPYLMQGDYLIVCGDFGYGFFDGPYFSENMFYDHIEEMGYTLLFVDGNHENFDKLYSIEVSEWHGGKVHMIRSNVIHLMRGQYYEIEDISLFTMGGGFSLDKEWRVKGRTWFSQEMPSKDEYLEAESNLTKHKNKVDYIISHTCPTETVYYLSTLGFNKNVYEERALTDFLQTIVNRNEYKAWFFGHFHLDKEVWRLQTAVLNSIINIRTGKIIHEW